jgi:hypothetical protein
MTVKEALRERIDKMSEDEAQDLLDLIELRKESGELTAYELAQVAEAEAEFARNDYVTREQLLRKHGA